MEVAIQIQIKFLGGRHENEHEVGGDSRCGSSRWSSPARVPTAEVKNTWIWTRDEIEEGGYSKSTRRRVVSALAKSRKFADVDQESRIRHCRGLQKLLLESIAAGRYEIQLACRNHGRP